jgi:hypothetical protein
MSVQACNIQLQHKPAPSRRETTNLHATAATSKKKVHQQYMRLFRCSSLHFLQHTSVGDSAASNVSMAFAVRITDLSDYIAPSQSCVVALNGKRVLETDQAAEEVGVLHAVVINQNVQHHPLLGSA